MTPEQEARFEIAECLRLAAARQSYRPDEPIAVGQVHNPKSQNQGLPDHAIRSEAKAMTAKSFKLPDGLPEGPWHQDSYNAEAIRDQHNAWIATTRGGIYARMIAAIPDMVAEIKQRNSQNEILAEQHMPCAAISMTMRRLISPRA